VDPGAANPVGLFVFAGEASGDQLGADLVSQLRLSGFDEPIWGVCGEKMAAEGVEQTFSMRAFQMMGFVGILTGLPRLLKQIKELVKLILERAPKAVVLIDYPDFNLRLARDLRRQGYSGKIIQYVSPTVWAWRSSRIPVIAERFDLLLTLFPFETDYFAHTSLQTGYVGHPAANIELPATLERESDLIGIFPGSRPGEIKLNLGLQLEAARQLLKKRPEARFAVSVARPELTPLIEKIVNQSKLDCPLDHSSKLLMGRCQAAFATSGTVTLELAIQGVPTVVTYRPSLLNAFIARYLFRIRLSHFCIVNILSKRTLFPERVHCLISAKELAEQIEPLFLKTTEREECLAGCQTIKEMLRVSPGRAAELVLASIETQ
jgi:lipid-A-disaccharide synthase